jgi:hypothetical protein
VLASLRPGSKDFPAAFRLRLASTPIAFVSLERSVLCAPLSTGGTLPRGAVVGEVRVRSSGPGALPPSINARQVTPRIKIDSTGEVREINIGAGSGIPEVDRSIRETLMSQRYLPATLDGRPVAVWVFKGKPELIRYTDRRSREGRHRALLRCGHPSSRAGTRPKRPAVGSFTELQAVEVGAHRSAHSALR